jgi:hypothetical protein
MSERENERKREGGVREREMERGMTSQMKKEMKWEKQKLSFISF